MRISDLTDFDQAVSDYSVTQSHFIFNYLGTDQDTTPLTYKITLNNLGKALSKDSKLVFYNNNDQELKVYIPNGIEPTDETQQVPAYESQVVGYYLNSTDKTVVKGAVTNVAYDTTNKKITQTKYGNTTSAADSTKYVSGVSETKGKISVSRTAFNPSITWTNAAADTNNAKPTINISVAGNAATAQTPNEASTTVYGITKLSNDINSTSEVLAATPKAVKDAIESLNITQITNTASQTIASLTETNGKVGAEFQLISILSSQISDRGTANNVATLDANGHVPTSQLPSYVDDIVEVTSSTFPAEGETGKIYVDTTTNISYRWSGSQYVKVASDLALGETSSTAYAGDKGKAAYDHATAKGSAFTSGFYKITTNAEGHVTAATPVQANDILTLLPSWINNENQPSTFTTITIGNTTLNETQLTALLALLEGEGEGE